MCVGGFLGGTTSKMGCVQILRHLQKKWKFGLGGAFQLVEAHFHLFECVWQGVLQIFRNITYWDIWRQCFLIQKLVPVKVFIALSFVFFHGQFLFTLTAIFCLFSNFFTPKVVFFSTKSFDFFTGRKLVIILLRSVIIRKKHRKNAFAKYLRIRLSVFFTGTFAFNGYTFPIFFQGHQLKLDEHASARTILFSTYSF